MLARKARAWEISDMAASDDLRGPALYGALMALKPVHLLEGEWASKAGVNRGFFTNLKSAPISPRSDTLRKLLKVIERTEADLYAVAEGRAPVATFSKTPEIAPTRDASEGETVAITALDLSASMGPGTLIEDFVESQPMQFDIGLLRAITRSPYHRLRVVRGIGDSMEPTLRTGDRILVDTTDKALARLDGIYWITLYGAHGIKRLKPAGRGRIMVVSDNRAVAEPQEVDAEDVTIEGRVIWFGRDL